MNGIRKSSPCYLCQCPDKGRCVGCAAWRAWYCARQQMINDYAQALEVQLAAYRAYISPVWRYELPLYPVRNPK